MCEFENDSVECRVVAPDVIRPMRQRVLRPHQPLDAMMYDGDDWPGTFHLAAINAAERVVGIASFYIDPHPKAPQTGDWRLRGMAVEPSMQGNGLGAGLVQAGLDHIRKQDGQRLWCNARVSAQGFYERLGFCIQGNAFQIEPIGPHYVMSIAVNPNQR